VSVATDTQALVIGSGAGGAVTALELARAGASVVLLEEGERHPLSDYGRSAPEAMRLLYRRRGMTPIVGSVPIGYVEGRCLGGSTEINSGFWHRTPPEILLRWKAQYDLVDALAGDLAPHFEWAEQQLAVSPYHSVWPLSTQVFQRGIDRMGWSAMEVPRMTRACECRRPCASGCSTGAKQSMARSLLPQAEAAGAKIVTRCRVKRLVRRRGRVVGVVAARTNEDGRQELVRISAEHVIVCCGPTETPSLLLRSGVKHQVAAKLVIHPMLKVAARFAEPVSSVGAPMPLLQVKEFWPEISLGGSFFSPGHLAMHLSENWPQLADRMNDLERMAIFYVAVRGTGRGSVSPGVLGENATHLRYELSDEDHRNLCQGMARLSTLLLEAGAEEVYPCVHGLPAIRNQTESIRWLDERVPRRSLSLTTVHAFSTCPIGERLDRTAADSFGKVRRHENLYLNDASILPDSPGVNPQGSVMALARRNAQHLAASVL
jgi:choline dehydrogenase-like flavoprotein